ncbi:hypothetical protein G6F50_018461 [Rhizopus delemar]|uniref:Uncharacterized protein n=1 Tax=Rhizopus delemar TaxID=936053 RepID=A0A9P6XMQ6_9FUNG|nr:hypothetical protein G6F50_018461 [Rhizopus delemar]
MPGYQTRLDIPVGRGLVRIRALGTVLAATHGDGCGCRAGAVARRPCGPASLGRSDPGAWRAMGPQGSAPA